jgi:hypothetical protein
MMLMMVIVMIKGGAIVMMTMAISAIREKEQHGCNKGEKSSSRSKHHDDLTAGQGGTYYPILNS